MSASIKASADGTQAIIQVGGVDKVTIGASGITAGSFAPNSIDAAAAALAFSGSNVSLASYGYQKLPSGLIIQWGQSSSFSSASNATVTLPIAFPTTNLSVVASWSPTTGKDSATPNIVSKSLTNFVVGVNNTNAGTVYWIALGY